jgi:hypothetical protein
MTKTNNTKASTRLTPTLAVGGTPAGTTSVSTGAASGSTSGASVPGTSPAAVVKPPSGFRNTVQQLVNGINMDIPADSPINVVGTPMTQAQLLAILQPVLAAFTTITTAENSVKQARLSLAALLPQAQLFVANLKKALIAQFGMGSPLLADFGVKDGATRKKPTTAVAAATAVKASATRVLRNTKGKVEKLAVKFTGQVSPAAAVTASGAPGSGNTGSTGNSGNTGA